MASDGSRASARVIERGALKISVGRDPQACVIRLEGELDLDSARSFEAELRRAEGSPVTTIVVDLSGLEFIDSSGISVLVYAAERSRADSGRQKQQRSTR